MSITKVNSATGRTTTGVGSLATTIGFTPVSGNVLVLYVGGSGTSGARSSAVSGWTKVGETSDTNGTSGGLGAMYIRISNGTEGSSPPTIVITGGNLTLSYIVEEWPGTPGGATDKIDTNFFPDSPTPVFSFNSYHVGGTSTAMASNTLVMPTADCLVLTGYMGRGSTSQPQPTWSGGATASTTGATGGAGFTQSAMQEVTSSGSSVTHVATGTNGQGLPVEVVGSACFRVGVTVGSGTTSKDRVAGASVSATHYVRVAGASTAAPRKVRVAGVAV